MSCLSWGLGGGGRCFVVFMVGGGRGGWSLKGDEGGRKEGEGLVESVV